VTGLVEFLLARIGEDELTAAEAGADVWEVADRRKVRWTRNDGNARGWVSIADLSTAAEHIARWDPARVFAECDAKRRIVSYADTMTQLDRDPARTRTGDAWVMLTALAAPYSSHPDYQSEWAA
jgi:hypothetical protein